jgi:hypothetical protein
MFFLVYLSAAVTWFSAKELREMLATCRVNNERDGITGMLLYKDGNFMQVLEGEESKVRTLLQRITGDLRHRGLVVIDSGPTAAREFGAWSMAFTDLSANSAALPEGYSEFMDLPLSDPAFVNNPERCHQLLQMFRQID